MPERPIPELSTHPDRAGWRPGGVHAPPVDATTLAAALTLRAAEEPDEVAYYLPDQPEGDDRLTVGELYRRACTAAAGLAKAGAGRGDRVCLCLDTSSHLIEALYGTLLAGAVPMLAEPPLTFGRRQVWLDRLRHMVTRTRPTVMVCAQELRPEAEEAFASLGVTVVCPPFEPAPWHPPVPVSGLDDPALIQFSSGTTSQAKGVTLSHRALMAAATAIARSTPFVRGDLVVSWLPLHHDMGLVGATFTPFLYRVPVTLLSPLSFATNPRGWPAQIHRFRGTVSPAPNFAYHLVTSMAERWNLDGLDLSCWRAAFNGAEVVDASTLRAWQQTFGPYGFRPEAMRPCYGMAEVGLAITFSPAGLPPRIETVSASAMAEEGVVAPPRSERDARELVSCGGPVPGMAVRVVGDDGPDLPDGHVGTVRVAGESMMTGYHGLPEETARDLRDGWLDTGDLGFTLGGELFVTGRAKDLIIVAGRNHLPQPIELAAASVDGVRFGGAAAVGLPDPETGTETLVVVVELRPKDAGRAEEIRRAVEQAVAVVADLRPSRVITVRPGSLPKTSSGKLQRSQIAHLVAEGLIG